MEANVPLFICSAYQCIARLLPIQNYRARQGTSLGRNGQINVVYEGGIPWIYGHANTVIDGTIIC